MAILLNTMGLVCADVPLNLEPAREAMLQKNWEMANYEWRHILDLDPHNMEATLGLAESLFNTGFYEDAVSVLEGIPVPQRTLRSNVALARVYKKMGNYGQSKEIYLKALAQSPYQVRVIQDLAALKTSLPDEDQKVVQAALDKVGQTAKLKGETAAKHQQYQNAARYYEIWATQQHTVGGLNDYGLLLLFAGQYAQAREQFVMLKKYNKLLFPEIHSNAGIASLSTGNYSEAKTEMMEAIAAAGTQKKLKAKLYNNLGYILEMSRKRTDAKFAYEHALMLDPNLITAEMNLGFVQQANRDFNDAALTYQKILKKNPQNAEIWNRLGFVYELSYKAKLAENAYQKAIAVDPQYRDSYFNLAALYKKMNKVKASMEMLRHIAELGYADLEGANRENASATGAHPAEEQSNPLKYVVLFPANRDIMMKVKS